LRLQGKSDRSCYVHPPKKRLGQLAKGDQGDGKKKKRGRNHLSCAKKKKPAKTQKRKGTRERIKKATQCRRPNGGMPLTKVFFLGRRQRRHGKNRTKMPDIDVEGEVTKKRHVRRKRGKERKQQNGRGRMVTLKDGGSGSFRNAGVVAKKKKRSAARSRKKALRV